MQESADLIKKINFMIISKVIEIAIVIILVGISIPAWNNFATIIGNANSIKSADYRLLYKKTNNNKIDFLTVENKYSINKHYKIYLETEAEISDLTKIEINNKSYLLKDFYSESVGKTNRFTLINKYIYYTTDAFSIKVNVGDNNINYRYIFEENNNF